jgi:hypothetical protein
MPATTKVRRMGVDAFRALLFYISSKESEELNILFGGKKQDDYHNQAAVKN